MKLPYGIIGDVHLGFRAYDSNLRSEECIDVFELAIELLYAQGIRSILIPGDLMDDTTWSNWIEKRTLAIFRKYSDVKFIVDGGNHDSTKTYSSVSALDVLAELQNLTIVNAFAPELIEVDGLEIVCVPHMKSQKEFIDALTLLAEGPTHHVLLLHSMVDSNLDLSPNDLNVTTRLLEKLSLKFDNIWIGHQHSPHVVIPNVIIPGSTLELNFGEMGKRFVYTYEGKVTKIELPQPRKMIKHDLTWDGLKALFETLEQLDSKQLTKLTLKSIPFEMYSQAAAAVDNFLQTYQGDLLVDLLKTGHTEVEISTIDAHFDLLTEFDAFYADNHVDDSIMRDMLEESIAEILGEEEDTTL